MTTPTPALDEAISALRASFSDSPVLQAHLDTILEALEAERDETFAACYAYMFAAIDLSGLQRAVRDFSRGVHEGPPSKNPRVQFFRDTFVELQNAASLRHDGTIPKDKVREFRKETEKQAAAHAAKEAAAKQDAEAKAAEPQIVV